MSRHLCMCSRMVVQSRIQPFIVNILLVTTLFSCKLQNRANAAFEFHVTLHVYNNVNHTLGVAPNIQCCDGTDSPDMCTVNCDNKFVLCLRDAQVSNIAQSISGTCTQQISTRPVSDTLTFEMGDGAIQLSPSNAESSAPNPVIFHGASWPSVAQFAIEVIDADDPMGAENDEYVDTVIVDLSGLTPSATSTPMASYSGLLGHVMFSMAFRLACSANYYGANCSKFCEHRYDNLGHYKCDTQGDIICKSGYTDESTNCIQCVPLTNCSSAGGYCNNPDECVCKPGYNGTLCDIDLDPCGHNDHCLHGGNCTNTGPNMYNCSCPENYVGENCHRSPSECTVGNCTNGGTCRDDYCVCLEGFSGALCDVNYSKPLLVVILSITLVFTFAIVLIITVIVSCVVRATKRRNKVQKMRSVDVHVPPPTDNIELHCNNSYASLALQHIDHPYYSVIPLTNNKYGNVQSNSLPPSVQLALRQPSDPQYYVNEGLGPTSSTLGPRKVPIPNVKARSKTCKANINGNYAIPQVSTSTNLVT